MKLIRLIFLLLLFPSLALAGQGMMPGPGFKTYSAGSSCAAGTNTGDLFSETFSGANTLTCGGTVALTGWSCYEEPGNTFNPDYDASALGCGFDTQSANIIRPSGSTNNEARLFRALSNPGEVFGRFFINVTSHSIASGSSVSVSVHNGITHGIRLYNDGGTLKISMYAQSLLKASYAISTGTTYRVEYNVDDTNDIWGWKVYSYSGDTPTNVVDTTEQAASITSLINDWQLGVFANEVVEYNIDNADLSTAGWIGE